MLQRINAVCNMANNNICDHIGKYEAKFKTKYGTKIERKFQLSWTSDHCVVSHTRYSNGFTDKFSLFIVSQGDRQ